MIHTIFFYFMAAMILISAYFVVTARNLFRSAIGLLSVLLGIAGLYLLMHSDFVSAVQVMVYIGGIVVLIVFVILLVADASQKTFRLSALWRKGVAVICVSILFCLMSFTLLSHKFDPPKALPNKSASVEEIGRAILSPKANGFVLPFEVISLVLIAALIGAITIARYSQTDESPKK
jgi:NADH-quinone oxidoreductase subunit J